MKLLVSDNCAYVKLEFVH